MSEEKKNAHERAVVLEEKLREAVSRVDEIFGFRDGSNACIAVVVYDGEFASYATSADREAVLPLFRELITMLELSVISVKSSEVPS